MRPLRFVALATLAGAAIAACKDSAPTSSVSSPPEYAAIRSAGGSSVAADAIPPVGGFSSVVLSRSHFLDDINITFRLKPNEATTVVHVSDPSEAVMARVTIQPGGALPWHTHPGPAIASVASGALTIVDGESCLVREYSAGTAFVDTGRGHVHTGYNATNVETVVYVTYLDVPTGQSPLVTAPDPGC
jgi:quercetin dioxygenase-like cupin family protein